MTPNIERYLEDFLEHYTDSIRISTDEIGVRISGYFEKGKSHLAKIASLLIENRTLDGVPAIKRFQTRIPADTPLKDSIIRSLSQYYISKGYSGNLLYARVIESEMDRRGKLNRLLIKTILDNLHEKEKKLGKPLGPTPSDSTEFTCKIKHVCLEKETSGCKAPTWRL
ncbi:MAG: hypothetical protein FVQ80_14765 [Planctomycetes bacterium]|nr:hypothetical protein [Planctomycetota bacterium]